MRLLLPSLLVVLALASGAVAFDRYHPRSGDTYLADALSPGDSDEYVFDVARGTRIAISAAGTAPGTWKPAIGVFGDDYPNLSASLAFTGTGGPRNVRLTSLNGFRDSQRIRILAQAGALSIGAYRLKVTLKPAKKFAFTSSADLAEPRTSFVFGAYPGYEATVQVRWKGTGPVTLTSLTGPDGSELTSSEAPVTKGRSFKQAGFTATVVGDHTVTLDVPAGTTSWKVLVRLAGSLGKGDVNDVRTTGVPQPGTVRFGKVASAPAIAIAGEHGGSNGLALSASRVGFQSGPRGVPTGFAFDPSEHGGSPTTSTQQDLGDLPTAYRLRGGNGLFAEVVNVVYDGNLDVTSYDVPLVRTPRGSGSARYSGFTYDADGAATGWIEERTYHATGRTHVLAITGIERFRAGAVKAFHVVHTAPGGEQREYDYAAFSLR